MKKIACEKYLKILFMAAIVVTFLLLLYKNPFSERNLVPNLEPFPDTIHYLNPALSFIKGHGLVIERDSRSMNPSVPFLYSIALVPGFLLVSDVRFFYITNIILALAGLFFFNKFLSEVIKNKYIVLMVLFLYVTNYFIYWYPNLPMAENLMLPLYLISLYLLVSKVTTKNIILASIIGIGFYATKYANLILTITFLILYLTKILITIYKTPKKIKLSFTFENEKPTLPAVFCLSTFLAFSVFFSIEFLTKGNNILYQVYELIAPIFAAAPRGDGGVVAPVQSWFSLSYFSKNFPIYINAIMGNPMRFLWDFTPLVPKYIALPALIGILAGILIKGFKFFSFSLLLLILTPIIFISTFYSTDARYIYNSLPSLLTGFGLFLNFIYLALKQKKLEKFFYLLLIVFFLFYAFTNLYRIKYQIALNLKHTETPWYYISARTFNDYFSSLSKTEKPPTLITALPPYYVDFYNHSGFRLLPLSREQEFTKVKEIVWGDNDYSNFVKLYSAYLERGEDLYVTNAGLGGTGYLNRDYDLIKNNFTLTKVKDGCLDTCNIFRLTPKN